MKTVRMWEERVWFLHCESDNPFSSVAVSMRCQQPPSPERSSRSVTSDSVTRSRLVSSGRPTRAHVCARRDEDLRVYPTVIPRKKAPREGPWAKGWREALDGAAE